MLEQELQQYTWTRRDKNQEVVDYEHFTVPFILTVDEILSNWLCSPMFSKIERSTRFAKREHVMFWKRFAQKVFGFRIK